jgi:hypothetical protein
MDYATQAVTVARSTSDDLYGTSTVDMLDAPQEYDLDIEEGGETAMPELVAEEPCPVGLPRTSYGIADILFPMNPPKPKGARLVRGPLRFN